MIKLLACPIRTNLSLTKLVYHPFYELLETSCGDPFKETLSREKHFMKLWSNLSASGSPMYLGHE